MTPKAIATRAEWLFELVSAGVGIGVAAHARAICRRAWSRRPVEGAALAHEINLTTKRGRLYSPPVKAFVDLALKPRAKASAGGLGRLSQALRRRRRCPPAPPAVLQSASAKA